MIKLSSLKSKLSAFTTDESGATVIEYAVIAGLIVAFAVVFIRDIGTKVKTVLSNTAVALP